MWFWVLGAASDFDHWKSSLCPKLTVAMQFPDFPANPSDEMSKDFSFRSNSESRQVRMSNLWQLKNKNSEII